MKSSFRKSLAVVLVGGGTAGGLLIGSNLLRDAQFANAAQKVEATREQLNTVNDLSTVFRDVGKVVEPSVVNINVRKVVKGAHRSLPFNDDLLKRFFKDRVPDNNNEEAKPNTPNNDAPAPEQEQPDDSMEQVGTGSGVILEVEGNTGYILTNNHVAGGASEMVVTLADGRQIDSAKLVGADAKSDLAVVKIEADHLIPAKWGDSSTLSKGDWILAFGSPFGYIGSMTHGIVSALDRSQVGILGNQGYEDFIQVDAPINPGNSGGPLVNIHGEVVGINTAIASRSGGFQGIGFAIPSNEAHFVYGQLKGHGKVTRGWLGVSIADVARDPKTAASFGYQGRTGVLVEQTIAGTPSSGKLQPGDIITAMNGKPVDTVLQLRGAVASTMPNTDVKLKVWRDGKDQDVTIHLGEQPEDLMASMGGKNKGPEAPKAVAPGTFEALGMTLTTPDDQLVQRYGLNDRAGALVTKVQPRSAAEKKGIQPGDLITKVGGQKVSNAREASDAIAKQDPKSVIRFYITNGEGSRFVTVDPQKS